MKGRSARPYQKHHVCQARETMLETDSLMLAVLGTNELTVDNNLNDYPTPVSEVLTLNS